jgi:hypothetical protein
MHQSLLSIQQLEAEIILVYRVVHVLCPLCAQPINNNRNRMERDRNPKYKKPLRSQLRRQHLLLDSTMAPTLDATAPMSPASPQTTQSQLNNPALVTAQPLPKVPGVEAMKQTRCHSHQGYSGCTLLSVFDGI